MRTVRSEPIPLVLLFFAIKNILVRCFLVHISGEIVLWVPPGGDIETFLTHIKVTEQFDSNIINTWHRVCTGGLTACLGKFSFNNP